MTPWLLITAPIFKMSCSTIKYFNHVQAPGSSGANGRIAIGPASKEFECENENVAREALAFATGPNGTSKSAMTNPAMTGQIKVGHIGMSGHNAHNHAAAGLWSVDEFAKTWIIIAGATITRFPLAKLTHVP